MIKILKLTWLKGIITAILAIILYLYTELAFAFVKEQPPATYVLRILLYLLLIYFIVMIIYTILYKLTKKEKAKIRRKIKQ